MKSFIVYKRNKKYYTRDYKRKLKTKRGKSKSVASIMCWSKNFNFLFALLLVCLLIMPAMSCKSEPVATKPKEAPVVLESAGFKLDGQMRGVSKYIYTVQKDKSVFVADYIAYSIVDLARISNVPVDLLVGLIHVESTFNPFAVSPKKAKGLMQICDLGRGDYDKTKKVYKEMFDQGRIFDCRYNIKCGIAILKDKVKKVQDDRSGKKSNYKRTVLEQALFYYVGQDPSYIDSVIQKRHDFSVFFMGVST